MFRPFQIQPFDAFAPESEGAWEGVSMDAYHAAPGESNSSLAVLARSPRRYRLLKDRLISSSESTHDQELGTMIHAAVNEGDEPVYHLQPDNYVAADGTNKPWNWNANACKAWGAKCSDKPILTAHEALMLNSVTACVRDDAKCARLMKGARHEISACARNSDLAAPYMLRCRFDLINKDEAGWYWIEVKSTRDASTEAFSREIFKRAYHVQCALYRRVLRKLTGEKEPRCFVMPVEKDAAVPRVNLRQLAVSAMDAGDKVLDERLALLAKCRLANKWPALPDEEEGDHVPFIDLPEYAQEEDDEISAS